LAARRYIKNYLYDVLVLALLVVLSIFVRNFWCRYLCPYGALMGFAALASPSRIRREAALCIDCAKCAKACPALLPVDRLVSIRSAECTACLECVAASPAEGALRMSAPHRRPIPAWILASAAAVLFLGICGYARWAGYWHTNLPERMYFDLIPHARQFTHQALPARESCSRYRAAAVRRHFDFCLLSSVF
jgi:ferredoxin